MGRHKTKICPDCNEHVSSTTIICSCGGSVVSCKAAKSTVLVQKRASRRTERTKRTKPSFYDSLQAENQAKEEKRRRKEIKKEVEKPVDKQPSPPPLAHRMQLTVKKVLGEPEIKEEELEEIVLSDETKAKFSLILNDINRKICASSWRGYF